MADGGYLFVEVTQKYAERLKEILVRAQRGDEKKAMRAMWKLEPRELSSQERAAKVAWALAVGQPLTMEEIRSMTGLGGGGARELMSKLSRVLPIAREEGIWGRVWGAGG